VKFVIAHGESPIVSRKREKGKERMGESAGINPLLLSANNEEKRGNAHVERLSVASVVGLARVIREGAALR
jgi:hypothetical protein